MFNNDVTDEAGILKPGIYYYRRFLTGKLKLINGGLEYSVLKFKLNGLCCKGNDGSVLIVRFRRDK